MSNTSINAQAASINTTPTLPNWATRGKIRRTTEAGSIIPGEYSYGGEICRVSPRYQKNGQSFRIRFERPSVAFACWAFDNGLLPSPMTQEEATSEDGLAILAILFEQTKTCFVGLEPAITAGDATALPDLTNGYSFLVRQATVEVIGSAPNGTTNAKPTLNVNTAADIAKKLEEMRAKASTKAPKESKAKPKKDEPKS